MRGSVENAVGAGATWFTWWCSHDIDRRYQFDDLEYDLGLFSTDNKPKPLAHIYRELIQEFRTCQNPGNPPFDFGADFKPRIIESIAPENWLEQNLQTSTWEVFERYLKTL